MLRVVAADAGTTGTVAALILAAGALAGSMLTFVRGRRGDRDSKSASMFDTLVTGQQKFASTLSADLKRVQGDCDACRHELQALEKRHVREVGRLNDELDAARVELAATNAYVQQLESRLSR